MEKYYFFRTVRDGSRERLRPLAGQTAHDGSVINPNFNTKGSKRMRESYPIGTVFCSKVCEQQGGYYAAGDLFPLDINLGDYLSEMHMPTPEMVSAYREFKEHEEAPADLFSSAGMVIEESTVETEAPKAFSMLEMLSSERRYVTPTVDSDGFSISDDNWRLLMRNILTGTNTMMIGPTGTGKCLGKDTPVLMYDGSIKMVQDVKTGDMLMGPDSKPRKVLSTTSGQEELYRITPSKGDSWVCNKSHILSLVRTEKKCGKEVKYWTPTIPEYLASSRTKKNLYKQWRTGVNFSRKRILVEPYFIGLWLGDGRSDTPTICTADEEIVNYLSSYAERLDCKLSTYNEPSKANSYAITKKVRNSKQRSPLQVRMDHYDLFNNKHIPEEYLHNCRKYRLELLAGLIDSDGHRSCGDFEYCTESDVLKDDVMYLCRSLGYYVHAKCRTSNGQRNWRLYISGNLKEVPLLLPRKKITSSHHTKNVCHTGIKVKPMGVGDYYGFTIDGDHLFLLGDFTVTHNTELVMLACRKLGIECNVYNMGTIFDPISELLGVHRLVGGSSTFDYAKFAKDVQKPGVILLDELSRAPVTTNNVLFPCLDSRRVLPVDMAGGDDLRVIPLHPKCVFVATANVGSEYTGTMSMDRALVARFFPLELGYMESEEEKKVLVKRHGISESDARNIVTVAATVRSKHAATELSSSLSTRETLMAARLISDGWSAQKAMELTFLPLFEGTKVEGERAVVMQIILSR